MAATQVERSSVSSLWLTHAESGDPLDAFMVACQAFGIKAYGHPFIQRHPEANSLIAERLTQPLSYTPAGIIFTSFYAAQLLMNAKNELPSELFSLPCLTLHGHTAERLSRNGWNVALKKGKNAEELALAILEENLPGPFLFPCGDKRRDTLPSILKNADKELAEVMVYTTSVPSPEMVELIRQSWYKENPRRVVFFSPSAVTTAATALKDLAWHEVGTIALGNTTAQALEGAGFRLEGIAEKPSSEELIKILEKRHS